MPAEAVVRFNKRTLEAIPLPPLGGPTTLHDFEVHGLQLRVTSSGTKSFCVFCRRKGGAPERITIGRFPKLSVERAREKAKRHLADLGEGIGVGARQRNLTLEAKTLHEVHREYLASRGITLKVVQRKDGKRVEQPHLSPATAQSVDRPRLCKSHE